MTKASHRITEARSCSHSLTLSGLFILWLALSLLLSGCQSENRIPDPNPRFKFVEDVIFVGRQAHIVLDTKTNIQYLYVWDGGYSNGGPAITRLWEK